MEVSAHVEVTKVESLGLYIYFINTMYVLLSEPALSPPMPDLRLVRRNLQIGMYVCLTKSSQNFGHALTAVCHR